MRYASIDLETAGDKPEKHPILEFGAVIEDTNNPLPYDQLPRFQVYIDNGDDILGTPYALQMNAAILKRIALKEEGYEYIKPEELGKKFANWLAENGMDENITDEGTIKITAAGKNFGSFDLQFLKRCPGFTEEVTISQRLIDPSVFYVNWEEDKELPNLNKCLERAGIEKTITHNAAEDAIDVVRVMRPVYNKMGL